MNRRRPYLAILLGLAITCVAAESSWINKVPEADRAKRNPYSGKASGVTAGSKLFAEYCSQCHGADASGRGKRPSLRSTEVQHATDGEIFWLLKNGNRHRGMPSWDSLAEQSRWQIVAYVKSLGESGSRPPQRRR